MAIKDEYEVARLHMQPEFKAMLNDEFEPGFTINYHLAPPLISWRQDGRGRPVKRRFGPWLTPILSALAKLRRIRGSVLDPFRMLKDRQDEQALIIWYQKILQDLPPIATQADADTLANILSAPLEMRGFGPVKDQAIKIGMARTQQWMQTLRG